MHNGVDFCILFIVALQISMGCGWKTEYKIKETKQQIRTAIITISW